MPRIELPDGPIEVIDTGGSGPVLVLCHGVPMTPETQWAPVLPLLKERRVVMPTLPMGGHRLAMRPGTDLSQFGVAAILGQIIEQMDLHDVVLILNDWGGGQFLLTEQLPGSERVAGLGLVACEAFDNFPPGPGKALELVARIPGGLWLLTNAMRIRPLRRARRSYGGMSRRGIPDPVLRGWFAPSQRNADIRRDFAAFATGAPDRRTLLAAAERLAGFEGPALVAWAKQDTMMPLEHGRRLADLLPNARLEEVDDSSTLMPLDQPDVLAGLLHWLVDEVAAGKVG